MEWGVQPDIEWKRIPQDILYDDGLGTHREKREKEYGVEKGEKINEIAIPTL